MSYEKQNFADGQVLKADHLNHIEEGISAVEESVATVEQSVATVEKSVAAVKESIAAVEESIPDGLPEVTESDNGRFLQVEDGKWTAVEALWQIIGVFNTCINDTFVPLEQSEYDAMVEAGTVEDNVYYLIAGDDE